MNAPALRHSRVRNVRKLCSQQRCCFLLTIGEFRRIRTVPGFGWVPHSVIQFPGEHSAGFPVAPLGIANRPGANAYPHGLRRF